MKGLAVHTAKIIEQVSMLECIKPYYLVGGTALSLQLHHRLSEDLDFMRWPSKKGDKMEVDWVGIERALKTVGELQKTEIMGFEHVEFTVSDVKFSFYDCDKPSPIRSGICFLNHIVLADVESIAIMKMEVLLRRFKFRDYYDLYCIFKDKSNAEVKSLIDAALKYSEHRLKTKNLISILTSGYRFANDAGFKQLDPVYDVSIDEIVNFMGDRLKDIYK
jgi:predicted nucleotidyltransferase component of viral defense system